MFESEKIGFRIQELWTGEKRISFWRSCSKHEKVAIEVVAMSHEQAENKPELIVVQWWKCPLNPIIYNYTYINPIKSP
jgi:hypothetical protein